MMKTLKRTRKREGGCGIETKFLEGDFVNRLLETKGKTVTFIGVLEMKKLIISTLAIVGLLAFVSTNTQAAEDQIGSTVNIECPVEIFANGGSLDFGLLAAPTNGWCDAWTVSPINGDPLLHDGFGNGVDFLPGDHSTGSFSLTGSELIYYYVYVSTDFSDPYLTLYGLTLDPLSPQDPSPANHNCDELDISVGGTLDVCEGVATGLHTDAVITIVANY
jgi:hypothetical protein